MFGAGEPGADPRDRLGHRDAQQRLNRAAVRRCSHASVNLDNAGSDPDPAFWISNSRRVPESACGRLWSGSVPDQGLQSWTASQRVALSFPQYL